ASAAPGDGVATRAMPPRRIRTRARMAHPSATITATARIVAHPVDMPAPSPDAGLPLPAIRTFKHSRPPGAPSVLPRLAQHEPVGHAQHPLLDHHLEAAAAIQAHVLRLVGFQIADAAAVLEPRVDRLHQPAADAAALARADDRRRPQV